MKKNLGLFLLTGLLVLGLAACGDSDEGNKTSNASEKTTAQSAETSSTTASDVEAFTITASNWKFTPDKELIIKKGSKVKLTLVNKEGAHSISNEKLGIDLKADAPAEFTADTTGEYELTCSTVCGATEDHEGMKISLKIID
ncbi:MULTISPECIES: cupredoxin domain-containing protein [Neobacillus]|jgi:heme/copper-type cytochrome/quinol oxidase subunit 2|uniref:cupredoxin domain-containing protein n=1 Tax=Neobacillus TaxID=2675232 RepID=UPI000BFA139A|nr:cupredoxin domain-containing protein [Neobacillus sp. OS1-33]PEQ93225.1 cytochrome C oxidase subunit II [Bacillus sp. AFS006103]WML26191.1 cupredoxin domain-containing protein [Neobacillus sp. OS1-33]